jgi:hypothetical protein
MPDLTPLSPIDVRELERSEYYTRLRPPEGPVEPPLAPRSPGPPAAGPLQPWERRLARLYWPATYIISIAEAAAKAQGTTATEALNIWLNDPHRFEAPVFPSPHVPGPEFEAGFREALASLPPAPWQALPEALAGEPVLPPLPPGPVDPPPPGVPYGPHPPSPPGRR